MKVTQKRADFYDASELFLEISIVLCSISLLAEMKALLESLFPHHRHRAWRRALGACWPSTNPAEFPLTRGIKRQSINRAGRQPGV